MHVLLSDVLTCPRCGPDFALLLMADEVEHRRVLAGLLSCANCRERFPITGGFADLRFGASVPETALPQPSAEAAMRIAAPLGVMEGPAVLLLIGSGGVHAEELTRIVPHIEVIAAAAALSKVPETAGVSRLATGERLPFRSGSMRGVALTDAASLGSIEEAARVVAPRARVLVQSSAADVATRLERSGLHVLVQDATGVVAERTRF